MFAELNVREHILYVREHIRYVREHKSNVREHLRRPRRRPDHDFLTNLCSRTLSNEYMFANICGPSGYVREHFIPQPHYRGLPRDRIANRELGSSAAAATAARSTHSRAKSAFHD